MSSHALTEADVGAVRSRIGRTGVWLGTLGSVAAETERDAAREIESLGYGALWFGEGGKESFAHAGVLLGATSELVIATGIASIYARDATAMRTASLTLGDAYPGRFVLGMGVSHERLVASRGQAYGRPIATMSAYLDAMGAVAFAAPAPAVPVPVVLAALRPRMLELAGARTTGAHPYFVPVAHTAQARETLGPDRLLAPEQMVLLEPSPERARVIARRSAAIYLSLPNYRESLRRLGYSDVDLDDGGSDRLIDDIVAWGGVEAVAARVEAHLEAGADHVAIQPLGGLDEQLRQLRELAPLLVGDRAAGPRR